MRRWCSGRGDPDTRRRCPETPRECTPSARRRTGRRRAPDLRADTDLATSDADVLVVPRRRPYREDQPVALPQVLRSPMRRPLVICAKRVIEERSTLGSSLTRTIVADTRIRISRYAVPVGLSFRHRRTRAGSHLADVTLDAPEEGRAAGRPSRLIRQVQPARSTIPATLRRTSRIGG